MTPQNLYLLQLEAAYLEHLIWTWPLDVIVVGHQASLEVRYLPRIYKPALEYYRETSKYDRVIADLDCLIWFAQQQVFLEY